MESLNFVEVGCYSNEQLFGQSCIDERGYSKVALESDVEYAMSMDALLDPNGAPSTTLAVGSSEGRLMLVDLNRTGETIASWPAHSAAVTDLSAFPHESALFVACSRDGCVSLSDRRLGRRVWKIRVKSDSEHAELWSAHVGGICGKLLACAMEGPALGVFDLRAAVASRFDETAKAMLQNKMQKSALVWRTEVAHSDDIGCIRFHPVRVELLVSGSDDGVVCIHDTCQHPFPNWVKDSPTRLKPPPYHPAGNCAGKRRSRNAGVSENGAISIHGEDGSRKHNVRDFGKCISHGGCLVPRVEVDEEEMWRTEATPFVGGIANPEPARMFRFLGQRSSALAVVSTQETVQLWECPALGNSAAGGSPSVNWSATYNDQSIAFSSNDCDMLPPAVPGPIAIDVDAEGHRCRRRRSAAMYQAETLLTADYTHDPIADHQIQDETSQQKEEKEDTFDAIPLLPPPLTTALRDLPELANHDGISGGYIVDIFSGSAKSDEVLALAGSRSGRLMLLVLEAGGIRPYCHFVTGASSDPCGSSQGGLLQADSAATASCPIEWFPFRNDTIRCSLSVLGHGNGVVVTAAENSGIQCWRQ